MARDYSVLSTDPKPINGVDMGSILIEVDTGKVFFFNGKTKEWVEQFSLQTGGGGGGNPNNVQRVEGTVADPFTDWSQEQYEEFIDAYYNGNASAIMWIDASVLGFTELIETVLNTWYTEPTFISCVISTDSVIAGYVTYVGNKSFSPFLSGARMYTTNDGIVDVSTYASIMPTVMNIIWHPLPN